MAENPSEIGVVANPPVTRRVLVLSAFGVHAGGGLVLLTALIRAASSHLARVALDVRAREIHTIVREIGCHVDIVPKRFLSRIACSARVAIGATSDQVLLCFNGLPPMIRSKAFVVVYIQNAFLVSASLQEGVRFTVKARIFLERLWIKIFYANADQVWVQSLTMQREVSRFLANVDVQIAPFVSEATDLPAVEGSVEGTALGSPISCRFSILYPADASLHKNHRILIEAWKLLAPATTSLPELVLTLYLRDFESLLSEAGVSSEQLNIRNVGVVSRSEVLNLMRNSSAVIYPSMVETVGLPLVEASALSIPIIASERDYVRDVCRPAETFDPSSPISIARAVARFCRFPEIGRFNFLTPDAFVDKLLDAEREGQDT